MTVRFNRPFSDIIVNGKNQRVYAFKNVILEIRNIYILHDTRHLSRSFYIYSADLARYWSGLIIDWHLDASQISFSSFRYVFRLFEYLYNLYVALPFKSTPIIFPVSARCILIVKLWINEKICYLAVLAMILLSLLYS